MVSLSTDTVLYREYQYLDSYLRTEDAWLPVRKKRWVQYLYLSSIPDEAFSLLITHSHRLYSARRPQIDSVRHKKRRSELKSFLVACSVSSRPITARNFRPLVWISPDVRSLGDSRDLGREKASPSRRRFAISVVLVAVAGRVLKYINTR